MKMSEQEKNLLPILSRPFRIDVEHKGRIEPRIPERATSMP